MCGITGTIKWATLTIVHQPYDDECLRFWHARHKEKAPKGKPCDCDVQLTACGCAWEGEEAVAPPVSAAPVAPAPPAVAPAPVAPAPVAQPPAAVIPPAVTPAPVAQPPAAVAPDPDTAALEAKLKAAIEEWTAKWKAKR